MHSMLFSIRYIFDTDDEKLIFIIGGDLVKNIVAEGIMIEKSDGNIICFSRVLIKKNNIQSQVIEILWNYY